MYSVDTHYSVPSLKKLHLILEMVNNGEIITFHTQTVYKCNNSFKRAMKQLHDKNVVLVRQQKTGNEYKLTGFGRNLGEILNELTA